MKFLRYALVIAVMLTAGIAAQAQFRFGVKAGVNVNSLHFSKDVFDSENRAGFTGGVMAEFTVPLVGVGADLSVMYVRRNSEWLNENNLTEKNDRDYIEIPLNFKYKLSLPAVSHIISPFVTTGPSFAFLTSRSAINEAFKNKTCDVAWNFGLGLQLMNKLQIGASYGIGLSKAIKAVDNDHQNAGINGKNRYWTVTAAYLF